MRYVVYETSSKRSHKRCGSLSGAMSCLRAIKAKEERYGRNKLEYAYTTEEDYDANINVMVTRTNLMTGKEYQEKLDTPGFCSPSSEAYWSA